MNSPLNVLIVYNLLYSIIVIPTNYHSRIITLKTGRYFILILPTLHKSSFLNFSKENDFGVYLYIHIQYTSVI